MEINPHLLSSIHILTIHNPKFYHTLFFVDISNLVSISLIFNLPTWYFNARASTPILVLRYSLHICSSFNGILFLGMIFIINISAANIQIKIETPRKNLFNFYSNPLFLLFIYFNYNKILLILIRSKNKRVVKIQPLYFKYICN